MTEENARLVLTVNSTFGGPWQHIYVLPGDPEERNSIVKEIGNKLTFLGQSTGVIFLENPSAVYSVSKIVRFGWTLIDPSMLVAGEVERQLGLNIPR